MNAAKTRRVLSIATLWPNAAEPRFGTFVARSLEALQRETRWDACVINPVGVPPIALGRYRVLAEAAVGGCENGVEVHRPTFPLIPRLGARFNPALIARAVLPLARKLHAENPFDLVDAQFFYPDGPAAARIARALGLPLSIKARGADIHYWGRLPFARKAMLDAADQAAGLLAVCEALAADMAALGMERGKIAVHYTGLDRSRFYPRGRSDGRVWLAGRLGVRINAEDHLLVTVGALIARKGQELVLRALAELPGARLVLVGKGEDEARLRRLSAALGIAGRTHFLGSLDHDLLPPLLSSADAMVLPSASEGLANAWIEALACGTPLIITEAGGAREVVCSPEAGLIVTREAGAIAQGIRQLLDLRPDQQEVAATASRFSWQANGNALAAHYDRLTG